MGGNGRMENSWQLGRGVVDIENRYDDVLTSAVRTKLKNLGWREPFLD